MPVTYVDGKPTIAYDSVNDKLNIQDADLQTKIDTLNTKIDTLNTKITNMQDGTAPAVTELSGSIPAGTNEIGKVQISKDVENYIVLFNAIAITNTNLISRDLITHGGLLESQVRQYKEFKISISNTHDQPVDIYVYTALRAKSVTNPASTENRLYYEASAVAATNGTLILQTSAGGTGAAAAIKTIPALKGVHSNIIVAIKFGIAPTSGAITVAVEIN